MLMNYNNYLCDVFGSVFHFGNVFESVFDTSDVFCNSIFICLNHVSKVMLIQLFCNLVMLMNCNYF